ncbi:MAG: hypothetical protein COB23_03740 [Methylophaga sp.]|nr:MAG: hypothetical protein COB23_03740 [Methylophaga sp.]
MHRLFFVLISLISTSGFTAEVDNLYQSYTPVATQSEQERTAAAPEILRQVILKVVGDRSALDVTDISSVLSEANNLVHQYQYQRLNKRSDDLTEPDRLALLVTFNAVSLNESLINLGLPIWGQRPEVLLWMAIDNGKKRTILGSETDNSLVTIIDDAADQRGLPLILPLMDLQDQAEVKTTDIWGDFTSVISQASQRYGSSVNLLAKVSLQSKNFSQITWRMLINGESEQWQSRGNIDSALQAGIEELTDRLARRFSQVITNENTQQLSLQIDNIDDYADYSRVMNYLSSLQYVSDIQLTSLSSGQFEVDVSLKGSLSVFNETLKVGRVLVEQDSSFNTHVIRYRLLP